MKKICVVTGTRAEYGLLKPVIDKIEKDSMLELFLIVTGAHLSQEFGMTVKEIEQDGYHIDKKIEMLLSSDTPSAVVKSMGVGLIGLADVLQDAEIDMMIILGDRYEIMIAAQAAMVFRIPVAHIHGGELTEGLIDEAIRHSITKMSIFHFASTEEYRRRIIQLGEEPERVYNVGALGVENCKNISLLKKAELEEAIGFKIISPTALVTFHPVTLENHSAEEQFHNLLSVLESKKNLRIIFTKANADMDGRIINEMIDQFLIKHADRCNSYASLGQLRYLSTLQYVDFVIGNSSSAIMEVPSFKIPSVDIGDRQRGRVKADSVFHCGTGVKEIGETVDYVMTSEGREKAQNAKNPYEGKDTSETIIRVLKEKLIKGIDVKKSFYDIIG